MRQREKAAWNFEPRADVQGDSIREEENEYGSLTEECLTEKAREGDRLAFGELVRRNRAKMYSWARSLTRDPHLAEDVLQEALIQAFLHVGRLVEHSRFGPWLARIVRNQALMKLRRGGPYAKERPFSGLSTPGGVSSRQERPAPNNSNERASDPYRDIDRILFHLSRHSEDSIRRTQDPVAALLRKELMEGIRRLFACLSTREKDIFEAHFFRHVTPQDIALALDTSVANVYNSISRARSKLQRERIRLQVSLYVKNRRDSGKPKAKLLVPPILYAPKEC